jgi:predicted DsbA family dithiol-disulfide isomerase
LGVRGTQAFFVNGRFLNGAQPYNTFEQAIERALSETE